MRALILILSALIVGLTVPVLIHAGGSARGPGTGLRFKVGELLRNAAEGEEATYRDQDGNLLTWRVEKVFTSADRGSDRLLIRMRLFDRTGRLADPVWGDIAYEHDMALHGWLPLMAPQEPDGLDRLWVWARIRQEPLSVLGKERLCWRVDAIDGALPQEREEVQAWMHPDVPVFGLAAWHRDGRQWTLVNSKRPEEPR